MGPDSEQSHLWIYFWYPLVIFIRMAQLLSSLLLFYIETGQIPYFDKVEYVFWALTLEFYQWNVYLFGYILLLMVRILVTTVLPYLPILCLFQLKYTRNSSRKARRRRNTVSSALILCFNCNLLILSEYMSYPWCSIFLSSATHWYTSSSAAVDQSDHQLSYFSARLRSKFQPWPPDGVLLHVMMLFLVIVVQLLVSTQVLVYASLYLLKDKVSGIKKWLLQLKEKFCQAKDTYNKYLLK